MKQIKTTTDAYKVLEFLRAQKTDAQGQTDLISYKDIGTHLAADIKLPKAALRRRATRAVATLRAENMVQVFPQFTPAKVEGKNDYPLGNRYSVNPEGVAAPETVKPARKLSGKAAAALEKLAAAVPARPRRVSTLEDPAIQNQPAPRR